MQGESRTLQAYHRPHTLRRRFNAHPHREPRLCTPRIHLFNTLRSRTGAARSRSRSHQGRHALPHYLHLPRTCSRCHFAPPTQRTPLRPPWITRPRLAHGQADALLARPAARVRPGTRCHQFRNSARTDKGARAPFLSSRPPHCFSSSASQMRTSAHWPIALLCSAQSRGIGPASSILKTPLTRRTPLLRISKAVSSLTPSHRPCFSKALSTQPPANAPSTKRSATRARA